MIAPVLVLAAVTTTCEREPKQVTLGDAVVVEVACAPAQGKQKLAVAVLYSGAKESGARLTELTLLFGGWVEAGIAPRGWHVERTTEQGSGKWQLTWRADSPRHGIQPGKWLAGFSATVSGATPPTIEDSGWSYWGVLPSGGRFGSLAGSSIP